MNEDAKRQDLESRLAETVCSLWEEAHGVPIGSARATIQDNRVRVYLEGVLSQAERESILRAEGQKLIWQYTEQLVRIIQPALQAQVESFTHRQVVSCHVHPDLEADCLECQFILD
jgi:uncharacterized protein YbcI